MSSSPTELKRALTPPVLWWLGVGYAISGIYFGLNLGLAEGGVLGLAITTAFIGSTHPGFPASSNALHLNIGIGIKALLKVKTAEIIILSLFGTLMLYIISMISLLKLRKKKPFFARSYRVSAYPGFPIIVLAILAISFLAITISNWLIAIIYIAFMVACYIVFKILKKEITGFVFIN